MNGYYYVQIDPLIWRDQESHDLDWHEGMPTNPVLAQAFAILFAYEPFHDLRMHGVYGHDNMEGVGQFSWIQSKLRYSVRFDEQFLKELKNDIKRTGDIEQAVDGSGEGQAGLLAQDAPPV